MVRSFASYLTDDVLLSSEEIGTAIIIIYLAISFLPFVVMFISGLLSYLTKLSFFENVIEWCVELCTLGVIERIFVSVIKYINTDNDRRVATEIPKGRSLYRINETIIKTKSARRTRFLVAVLFPLQGLIISIVILDKFFVLQQSVETCETYQQLFEGNPIYDKGCSIRPKFAPNISASEFFNPINAFRPSIPPPTINITGYCQNLTTLQNETSSIDYVIRCMKYIVKWNNIIDTLTNVLQWHQITAFIFKTICRLTYKWQDTLGHSQWWSKISISYRLTILVLLTVVWTAIFVIYLLIIIAFFKTLTSIQLILTVQTAVVLLVPLLFIPLPFCNALTTFYWTIYTIQKRDYEQEISHTLDTCRNVLIYTKDDEH
jgi:hypothetical protein